MRLEDEVIPATPLLKSWHIYKVDVLSLFHWDDQGLVRMDGEFIADHTMIDIVSRVPNYYVLRNSDNIQLVDHPSSFWEGIDRMVGASSNAGTSVGGYTKTQDDSDSPFVQVPDNSSRPKLIETTQQWIQDVPQGWRQVEEIVNHFRSDFELDDSARPPDDCEDSVGWFLENKKGPAYLFASTATQALRCAGYKTRLASGFLATRDDYDRISNQSIITSDNFHMWPEICLDGWNWLPAEPTPGFPIPYNTMTLGQMVASAFAWLLNLVIFHPIQSFAFLALVYATYYFWRVIVANLVWVGWGVGLTLLPKYRLTLTRKLIDLRFWAANLPRPEYQTPTNWISQVDGETSGDFIRLWQADNYHPGFDSKSAKGEIYQACRTIVQALTVQRIRLSAHQNNSEFQS